ncbi:MAG: hypothetical protein AAF944_04500 [Bacteroidota bacterium]
MRKVSKAFTKMLRKIGFELIPVILGILIALLINDYRQNLKEEEQTDTLLENLVGEFAKRRDDMEYIVQSRQQPLLDTIRSYLQNSELPAIELFYKAGGFGFPEVYTISWESTLGSQDINTLDFELLVALSRISSGQKDVEVRSEAFYNFLYSPEMAISDRRVDRKNQLNIIISDFIESEKELINRYNNFISLTDSLQKR